MDQQPPPEPPRPPIKLYPTRWIIFMIVLILGTSVFECLHEYYTTGHLSRIMLFASILTTVFGTTIVLFISWYGNKPEK